MDNEMIYETKYFKVAKVADIPDGERLFFEKCQILTLFLLKKKVCKNCEN